MTAANPWWVWVIPGFIGLLSGGFGVWSLKNGKTRLKSGRWITRAKEPIGFWLNVAGFLMLSAILISIVIYHLLISN